VELLDARVEAGRVVACWRGGNATDAPGILLMRAGWPLSWPYTQKIRTRREQRRPVRCELDVRAAEWEEAWVLRDHERVACLRCPGSSGH
jgi:hypothetical protein